MLVYKFLDQRFGLKSIAEKRLKISILSDLNDPFELLPYEMSNPSLRLALRRTRDEMAQNHGLLCFSVDWKDPVIWAHYADKHKGFCLGFEVPDQTAQRITYVSERLRLSTPPTLKDSNAMLFTKFKNWEYEQEIRIWTDLKERDGEFYFANFGESLSLQKVIAGDRCVLSKQELVDALGLLIKDVTLIKARAGFKGFEIVKDRRGFPK